jgi:hypothetical protein
LTDCLAGKCPFPGPMDTIMREAETALKNHNS